MDRIELQLDDAQVRRRLGEVLDVVSNPTQLMAAIKVELLSQTEQAFQDEGPGWAQLSKATLRSRARKGRGAHPILQVTNALARSITGESGADYALVGSNLVYAPIQQLGGTIKRAAYGGKLRLRTDRKGNLLRQGTEGRARNLAVFARERGKAHANYVERRYEVAAHEITIPARPFLPFDENRRLKPSAASAVMAILTNMLTGK